MRPARLIQDPKELEPLKGRGLEEPLKEIRSTLGRELDGRIVILCVTGSVASIEVPALARDLMRHGADVNVVMSEAAEKLVRPETLEWATGNPVVRKLTGKTEHVRLAGNWKGRGDLVLVAPCTANTISKLALGIDDTPVTTICSMALGGGIPLLVAPAAHEPMYWNPAVVENGKKLRKMGAEFVGPKFEEGKAKMSSVDEIVDAVIRRLAVQDFRGVTILVTGGPTVEFIDPVRVITNRSSGKMGLAIAKEAWRRGADVAYVYGGELAPPEALRSKRVLTTKEMMDSVLDELSSRKYDVFVSAAAPADFSPSSSMPRKIRTRSGPFSLDLKPTPKIVNRVRKEWPKIFVAAFKAETAQGKELERAAENFRGESRVDLVVANDASKGKAFGTDIDSVLMVDKKRAKKFPPIPKEEVASKLLDRIHALVSASRKH